MRDKFIRFMQGRYGVDNFSKFLVAVAIILMLLANISRMFVFSAISMGLLVYLYFRVFSRNFNARYKENQKYLQMTSKIRKFYENQKKYAIIRKTHHIFKCPGCAQKIKIPNGKGKVSIRCPKCGQTFIRKS